MLEDGDGGMRYVVEQVERMGPTRLIAWPCICVLKRQYLFGAYKAGVFGVRSGWTATTRLKEELANSIAIHMEGRCNVLFEHTHKLNSIGELVPFWDAYDPAHDHSHHQELARPDRAG